VPKIGTDILAGSAARDNPLAVIEMIARAAAALGARAPVHVAKDMGAHLGVDHCQTEVRIFCGKSTVAAPAFVRRGSKARHGRRTQYGSEQPPVQKLSQQSWTLSQLYPAKRYCLQWVELRRSAWLPGMSGKRTSKALRLAPLKSGELGHAHAPRSTASYRHAVVRNRANRMRRSSADRLALLRLGRAWRLDVVRGNVLGRGARLRPRSVLLRLLRTASTIPRWLDRVGVLCSWLGVAGLLVVVATALK